MTEISQTPPVGQTPVAGQKGPLPLIVGITGHRDLRDEDLPTLEGVVRKIFQELRAKYPHTPLIMLSPLGEGADRLTARVALSEGFGLIVPLPLPRAAYESDFHTPESLAEFRELLGQAQSVFTMPWVEDNSADNVGARGPRRDRQFAAMGAYIARHSQLLLAMWDGDARREHERTGGTAQIVRFRLEGAPPPYGPPLTLLDSADNGSVCHIVTPRVSNPTPHGEPFSRHEILPQGSQETTAERSFRRIEGFNRDAIEQQSALSGAAATSIEWLLPPLAKPDENTPPVPAGLPAVLSVYSWADALAIDFAKKMWSTVNRIFLSVCLAALLFNLFHSLPHGDHSGGHGAGHGTSHGETHGAPHGETHADPHAAPHDTAPKTAPNTAPEKAHSRLPFGTSVAVAATAAPATEPPTTGHQPPTTDHSSPTTDHSSPTTDHHESTAIGDLGLAGIPWFLWLYLLVVAVNVMIHRRVEEQEFQNKYQDYRSLAEGLRVQIFWNLAGLPEEVDDYYLGKQRSELDWIRHAIKACYVLSNSARGENPDVAAERATHSAWLPIIRQHWVKEQQTYFARKSHRELEELERNEKRIGILLGLSVSLTILLALILALPVFIKWPPLEAIKHAVEQPLLHGLIMIAIVMLAVCAGLLHGYTQQKAYAEHSKRFNRMGLLFQNANRLMETMQENNREHEMQAVLLELGKEALGENGDWVLLHRERPLEVPHAA